MTLLSDAVKIANDVTLGLQMQSQGAKQITLQKYDGDGGVGAPQYTSKKYDALVEKKQRQVRTFSGELGVSHATVTFLVPTIVVSEKDRIVLSDGTDGAVIGISGPMDESGQLLRECYLG